MSITPAGTLALAVAERLLRPEAVLTAISGTESASLAHGLAGTALLHARLATIDPVFRTPLTATGQQQPATPDASAQPARESSPLAEGWPPP
ncbi:MAG TPA: hypothetical protein VN969_00410 [Streptosporangiaceae bacterium]|nr:hypothetical protein [Streptosporangiaceae bacterium]